MTTMCPFSGNSSSSEVYLTGDERYDVWLVKTAERPLLLERFHNFEEKKDEHEEGEPPLEDGCDIAAWRAEKLVSGISCDMEALLRVGQGCPLTRRESQLPHVGSRHLEHWRNLRQKLLLTPSTKQQNERFCRIPSHDDCIQQPYPWFERQGVPVLVEGLAKDWPAMHACTFRNLCERYGHLSWRFSDTHGETMTLAAYQKYVNSVECATDDAPLAVYDSQFALDERTEILQEYQVPPCFASDLFEAIPDEQDRPPFRWILMGPERSGTGLHIDPVGTHAWVTLLEGCKRWILFPAGYDLKSIYMQEPQIPSSIWFHRYYDEICEKHPRAVHIVQHPGETVYVPAHWPHLVINLDLSVAITQNYATEYPYGMQRLWEAVNDAEPALTARLYTALLEKRSDLCASLDTHRKEEESLHNACRS